MKQSTIQISIFETGDLVEIDFDGIRLSNKRRSLAGVSKGLILSTKAKMDGSYSYKVLNDNGVVITLQQNEVKNGVCLGHIDLTMLLGEGQQ